MGLLLENVSKSFFQGELKLEILKGLNLQVKEGEVMAVMGPSGSGKSTLLTLLAGLDRPDQGRIMIGKDEIQDFNEKKMTLFRGKNIGIIFQQFHLMNHLTALENVMLPLEILGEQLLAETRERAFVFLEELGLSKRKNHFPSQLSGGECQRVAIARALVVSPRLLLADEPSGNLDLETGEKVLSLFFQVVKKHKITTIIVTHDESLAAKCDEVKHLQKGQLC